jgi:hypothetical protein
MFEEEKKKVWGKAKAQQTGDLRSQNQNSANRDRLKSD